MTWQVPEIWKNGDVWIIGGGPSIISQFNIPGDVSEKVKAGQLPLSAYSDYMESIHKKHVIGINVAYMIGDWIDWVFFGDGSFFDKNRKGLFDFRGLVITCSNMKPEFTWIKYLIRDRSCVRGITNNPKAVSWNHNSGAAAISIAAHAGAKRIFLLGFDMNCQGNTQHFHGIYRKNGKSVELRRLPFENHLKGFPKIADDAKKLGITIYNVCPTSAIMVFPKISLQEALQL